MEYDTADAARQACPRAIVIARTQGGKFVPFTTYEAYSRWKETK